MARIISSKSDPQTQIVLLRGALKLRENKNDFPWLRKLLTLAEERLEADRIRLAALGVRWE